MRLTTAYVFTVLVTCPGAAVAQFEASALEVSGGINVRAEFHPHDGVLSLTHTRTLSLLLSCADHLHGRGALPYS